MTCSFVVLCLFLGRRRKDLVSSKRERREKERGMEEKHMQQQYFGIRRVKKGGMVISQALATSSDSMTNQWRRVSFLVFVHVCTLPRKRMPAAMSKVLSMLRKKYKGVLANAR